MVYLTLNISQTDSLYAYVKCQITKESEDSDQMQVSIIIMIVYIALGNYNSNDLR